MAFVAMFGAAACVAAVLVVLLVRLGFAIAREAPVRFWRRATIALLCVAPALFVVGGSVGVAILGVSVVGTRPDERAYAGPRTTPEGKWIFQSRESLRAEREGSVVPDAALVDSARRATLRLTASDEVGLRAFFVPVESGTPRATVVLVHGLFRGALELEAPAAMFRDAGCDVVLLEMRNHGGSDRATPTFGLHERRDVEAAVAWVRSDPARAARPLILFAVSLGTAAATAAAVDVPDLAALVLDAPAEAMLETAHRMLAHKPEPPRKGLGLVQPFRSLVVSTVELLCGFRFEDVRPIDAIRRLSPDVRVLLVGGGEDSRMPPEVVRAVFDALPTLPDRKELWIRDGSDHGVVWLDAPDDYARRLRSIVDAVAAAPGPSSPASK
jgi:uncharacterized protein